jgi:diguanylate cyclase (GGDEF)-like protein
MQRQIRPADTFARLGGDEFAVLVSTARTEDEVREIVRRLSDCFKEAFEVDRNIFIGAASFGVSFYPVDGQTKDALFNAADSRMYVSKRARKDHPALQNTAM